MASYIIPGGSCGVRKRLISLSAYTMFYMKSNKLAYERSIKIYIYYRSLKSFNILECSETFTRLLGDAGVIKVILKLQRDDRQTPQSK